ncbi:probable disease resistance protein At5g45440 [Durio zibethinus]|uniref:Probable disease resistance protein At5g45440 n=1 Tax=Durio zibethinus TaxID=66656 RepID=A0A6P5YBT7_DURZI|nr:probable disease resistance protein At5g45440 [Durio zibethinus]
MSSSSKKEILYDEFLKTLPKDDEESSPSYIQETIKSLCPKITTSGSADHSIKNYGGDGIQEESDPGLGLTTDEKKKQFLEKIYEPVEQSEVQGFDYDEKSLKMLLLNEKSQDSIKLIGVVGVLGVGKTTLCRLIFNEEEVKQRFVPRIWISMSEELKSMEDVVKRMLEHLGVEEEIIESISNDHKLPGLLYSLHLKLKGKRFLIVFDDVRNKEEYYEKLESCLRDGHGFPKGSGGAVIVSSRNQEAIKKMVEEQNLHRLLPLSDPDCCWGIYRDPDDSKGEKDSTRLEVMKEVKEELKKKCGGFPLAARIMREINHLHEEQMLQNDGLKQASAAPKDGSGEATTT